MIQIHTELYLSFYPFYQIINQLVFGSFVEPNPKRPCWNHLISLPEKNNIAYPIFELQMELIGDLESGVKYQILKKSRGAGRRCSCGHIESVHGRSRFKAGCQWRYANQMICNCRSFNQTTEISL